MLIQDIKCGIILSRFYQYEFTMRKRWYLQIFLFPTQVYTKSFT